MTTSDLARRIVSSYDASANKHLFGKLVYLPAWMVDDLRATLADESTAEAPRDASPHRGRPAQ